MVLLNISLTTSSSREATEFLFSTCCAGRTITSVCTSPVNGRTTRTCSPLGSNMGSIWAAGGLTEVIGLSRIVIPWLGVAYEYVVLCMLVGLELVLSWLDARFLFKLAPSFCLICLVGNLPDLRKPAEVPPINRSPFRDGFSEKTKVWPSSVLNLV